MEPFVSHLPTKVVFGQKCLDCLPQEAGLFSFGGRNCLLVCGQRFARMTGLLERICGMLGGMRCNFLVFDRVEPNPLIQTVMEGAALARKHRARWILAVGGGSALDAAKAIALMAVNQGELLQYAAGMKAEIPPLPLLAIPTTAGTGSEVTPYAIISDSKSQDKFAVNMPELFPRLALLDPELSSSMPENVTIDTGLDALCHAVEAYFSRRRSPLSDLMATYAVGIIWQHLPQVRAQPNNIEARGQMMLAACAAGMAIANTGTLVPHALSYPITIRFNLSHGRAVALLETAFLEVMAEVEPERAGTIGMTMGDGNAPAEQLRRFVESLGVAPRLGAWGVRQEVFAEIVKLAQGKRHCQLSPGQWGEQELSRVLQRTI